jgi:hypothetical protein
MPARKTPQPIDLANFSGQRQRLAGKLRRERQDMPATVIPAQAGIQALHQTDLLRC